MKKLLVCLLTFAMLLSGCSSSSSSNAGEKTAKGTGKGIMGDVVVEVTATEDKIISVKVIEQNETQGIGSIAVEKLPDAIVEANSVKVDGVATATITSDAIKAAVLDAIKNMGFDPAKFENENAGGDVEKTEETIDTDIVIIGAGGAGLTAAARAAQEGVNIIIVEKLPLVGGNTLKATGGMNAAGTKFQAALDITDSTVETFIEDTMNGGHQLNNIDLVTTMAQNSSEAVDWLESIGAPLPKVAATGGTVHKYLHEPEDGSSVGTYLVEKLSAFIETQENVKIMLETEATEILTNEEGAAVGILANDKEHNYTINAKAVIITAGGFGANFDMMASYDPALANAVTTNSAGATGDGINMATAIGADTVDMEQIQLHPTVFQDSGLLVSESVRSMGGILVNKDGVRFTNDMSTRDAVSQAELKQPDAYAYIIFDQRVVDDLKSCQKYIDAGITVKADTYEELAKLMELTDEGKAAFPETMAKWNAAVAAGEDTEFGRNNGMDDDLGTAPYYAIKIAPGIHHTMGGIKINTTTEVINTEGNAIAGLFAAGEVCGGVHGGNRIGGNAVCDIVVYGRIAGASAVEYINK